MMPEPLKNKLQGTHFAKDDVVSAVALHRSREFILTQFTGGRICSYCKSLNVMHVLIDNRICCRDCTIKHDFEDAKQ